MKGKALAEFTDDELLQEAKKQNSYKTYDAVIIGVLMGIAIYSAVKNGFGLLIFIPLLYLPAAAKNRANKKKVERLLTERNLK